MAERISRIAGCFVPQTQEALEAEVDSLLEPFESMRERLPSDPLAIVSPHAGWRFCGKLTAAAWMASARLDLARIAILSPSHHVAFDGIAVPTGHDAVRLVEKRHPLDTRAIHALIRSGLVHGFDAAFEEEHGIDTQLPFARHLHPKVPLVPVVLGRGEDGAVAKVIERLARMEGRTLFVLSSDLSHFLPQGEALKKDAETAALLECGLGGKITSRHACGARALRGWLASGPGRASKALRLGMYTSAKETGEEARVVGYGAWGLFAPEADILDEASRQALLKVARQALASRIAKGVPPVINAQTFGVQLRGMGASFVTLTLDGQLRGCVGSMVAHRALVEDVAANAVKAGFEDPRFPDLTREELERLTLSVSVLSRPAPLDVDSDKALAESLTPGTCGAILRRGGQRGLFLPSVWESLPEPDAFVQGLRRKAGLEGFAWDEQTQAEIFRAEVFREPL